MDQKELIDPVSKVDGSRPVLEKTKHLYIDLPKMQKCVEKFFEERQREILDISAD
jgi:methionyl-tRNA synthetase